MSPANFVRLSFMAVVMMMIPASEAFFPMSRILPTSGTQSRGGCTNKRILMSSEDSKQVNVMLRPCKKLCPGCQPWLCPLSPQSSQDNASPELSPRVSELQHRQLIRNERDKFEAIIAGVRDVSEEGEFYKALNGPDAARIVVVFWGGMWCRKCQVLKPKYVTLSNELNKMGFDHKIDFLFVDVKKVGKSVTEPAGVTTVPSITVFKDGQAVGQYVAGTQLHLWLPKFIPEARELIVSCARSDLE